MDSLTLFCSIMRHIDVFRLPFKVWVFADHWLVTKDTGEEWPYAICSKSCMHIVGQYRPMNEKMIECAEKALCDTDEGKEAFAFIRSRLVEEGYDEHYFDTVYRKRYNLRYTLEDAERIRKALKKACIKGVSCIYIITPALTSNAKGPSAACSLDMVGYSAPR